MYYRITRDTTTPLQNDLASDGRYVLHRHVDAEGPHLDLRLEQDGYLAGYRIEGGSLDEAWATAKEPHPLHWLEHDGDATRLEAGEYTWLEWRDDGGVLLLRNGSEALSLRVAFVPVAPAAIRGLLDAIRMSGVNAEDCAQLLHDGLEARRRAIARLCGLARELDGEAFSGEVWRKALAPLSLREIHTQLETFEQRFDAKYPPQPVSRPERIDADSQDSTRVMSILAG